MSDEADKIIVIVSNDDDDDEMKGEARWRWYSLPSLDVACTLRYRQGIHAQKRYS